MNSFLANILNSPLLIAQQGIDQYAPVFINSLQGIDSKLSKVEIETNKKLSTPVCYIVGSGNSGRSVAYPYDSIDKKEKYTMVIPILGGITKYNQFCGPTGTTTKHEIFKSALADDSIDSIVFKFDTPGGQASYLDIFANEIANSSKPTIAYIEGMAASAGYWIASQCDEVYMSSALDSCGSIGAYATYASMTKYFAKKGIDLKEVYSSKSNKKNKFYRDLFAENPDDSLIVEELDYLVDAFHKAVTSKRSIESKDALEGAMFSGNSAIENKLADGIKSFDEVLIRAKELTTNNLNTKNMNTKEKSFKNISATIGLADNTNIVLIDGHASLSEENLDAIEATIEANSNSAAELQTANETISANESTIADLNTQIQNLTSERDSLLKFKPKETSTGKDGDKFENNEISAEEKLLQDTKNYLGIK